MDGDGTWGVAVIWLQIAGGVLMIAGWLFGLWLVALWVDGRRSDGGEGGLAVVEDAMVPDRPGRYRGTRRMGRVEAPVRVVARVPVPVPPVATEWPLVPLRSDPCRDTVQVKVYDPPKVVRRG